MRATVTIDEALEAFLQEQRERLSPRTMRNYGEVVFLLRSSLNSYAYDSLDEVEQSCWRQAFDDGDEEAFTKLFGPDQDRRPPRRVPRLLHGQEGDGG